MIIIPQQPLHQVKPNARHVTSSLAKYFAKPLHGVCSVATFEVLLLACRGVVAHRSSRATRPDFLSRGFRLSRNVSHHDQTSGHQKSHQLFAEEHRTDAG